MNGFFKLVRGTNNLGIESDCTFGQPKDTWTKGGQKNHTNSHIDLISKLSLFLDNSIPK